VSWLVLEGCDGTGKTTLADALTALYGVERLHVGPPQPDRSPLAEHLDYLERYPRALFERFHLGGFVYGAIFRPHQRKEMGDWHAFDWGWLEGEMQGRSLLVLCDPGWDRVEDEWGRRQGRFVGYREYEKDVQTVRSVYDRFRLAYERSFLEKTTYDWTREGEWERLTQQVKTTLGWKETPTT